MTHITIDDALVSQLGAVTGPVTLCDPSGRVVGQFVPASSVDLYKLAEDQCPYSQEELSQMRARAGQGGKKLSQILKELGIEA